MQITFFLCFLGLTIFYFAFELFPDPFGSNWCFALFAGNPIPQASETEQQQKPCKVVHWIVTCKHEIYIAFPQCLHQWHVCSIARREATSEQGGPKHPARCTTIGHHLRTVSGPHPPRQSACCRHTPGGDDEDAKRLMGSSGSVAEEPSKTDPRNCFWHLCRPWFASSTFKKTQFSSWMFICKWAILINFP